MTDLIRREDALKTLSALVDAAIEGRLTEHTEGLRDAKDIIRGLPAVQPATDPDYCYDEAWEYTMPWGDRDTLVEWADLTKPVPIYTLIKGPTKWAVNIPLDTDGDGEADDFELTWFDSEDAALAALKGERHE